MRFIIIVSLILIGDLSLAAGNSHGAIPWSTITAQIINVVLAIGILIYFLRKPVQAIFEGRVETFDKEFKKAQKQKQDAEAKRNEINSRLKNLKVTADKSISDAKAQANQNTENLMQETEAMAKRMIAESESKVQNQVNKVVSDLKMEILSQSFDKAKERLADNISQPELNRLKQEFIKNFQVVQ